MLLGDGGVLHTLVFDGYISDNHEMSSAFTREVVFGTLLEFPGVFVPRHDRIVKGDFTLKRGRLTFVDLNVVDAFGEMNLFS